MIRAAGFEPWFGIEGDSVVAFRRGSKLGGSLIFLLNLERRTARSSVKPLWEIQSARDLLTRSEMRLNDGVFELEMEFGEVRVIHCTEG